jgi:hypothetical protein
MVMVLSQGIGKLFYEPGPFQWSVTGIEGFMGYRFPESDYEVFVSMLICLSGKQEHLQIGFDPEKFPEIGRIIEEVGIPACHMDGDHISVGLPCFGNKAFMPYGVPDQSPGPS